MVAGVTGSEGWGDGGRTTAWVGQGKPGALNIQSQMHGPAQTYGSFDVQGSSAYVSALIKQLRGSRKKRGKKPHLYHPSEMLHLITQPAVPVKLRENHAS